MATFADRLRALQKDRHLTKAEFAKTLGIALGTLNGYLSGGKNPKIDTVADIAHKMGVSIGWLCGEDDIKKPRTMFDVSLLVDVFSDVDNATIQADEDGVQIYIHSEKLAKFYSSAAFMRENMEDRIGKEELNATIEMMRGATLENEPISIF